ncbi:MAG: hypothetical protein B7Y41_10635 [Hydrogenophilales bacterium 28-61-23]|nr:MAG: hypothetical protein B7Y41_10635 [Hydrogenophilales bacterium 28-61-23]
MKLPFAAKWCAVGLAGLLIGACTQMPTEKQGVSDLRPQLSFKTSEDGMRAAHVFVDGLDMGSVGDYLEGVASLRVLSGVHAIRVDLGGRAVVEEKIYLGDGVNRTVLVK